MATVHRHQHPLPSLQTTVRRVERGSERGSTMKGGGSIMNRVSQRRGGDNAVTTPGDE
jgi:hypothetical protein